MESLGEKLKAARESKKLSHDQIGRETNIAIRYLEALEAEEFSKFPGEPYVIGFIRNYGEYLGLDVQELLSLYRSLKIQEQAVPVEQLLKAPPPSPKPFIIAAAIILGLGLAAAGAFFFLKFPRSAAVRKTAVRTPEEYTLNGSPLERRFYQGDVILVTVGSSQYKMELSKLGETVTLSTPAGPVIMDLSQDVFVDLNNDGLEDLRITVADFVVNDPSVGALLRLEPEINSYAAAGVPAVQPAPETSAVPEAAAAVSAPVIFNSSSAYPFTIQVIFQGYCMFRWDSDRRVRNEQYFVKTDELNIQAQNGVRIWVSNAAAVKMQITGGGRTVPLEIGSAGEVVVADIRWVRDDDGRFRLILSRLEQA
ncbi:MAG: helix-turn-helix domain-containing protein [Treponema sp.]|nr:helix-turn-helix domain-containing protein [Treponema sp.]